MSNWHAVSESTPQNEEVVLILSDNGYKTTARYKTERGGRKMWSTPFGKWNHDKVKAWCHLPPVDVKI